MKILIAYASKSGTAKEAAELLAADLQNHTVTVADIEKKDPVPGDFDYIVLGGPIRGGKAHKALRRYTKKWEAALAAIPHTLFLCCAYADLLIDYMEMTFPTSVRESAEEQLCFGGVLDVSRQRGLDRLIARMMRNSILEDEDGEQVLPCLMPEHIRVLADRLRVRR
ncbi:MAG: hypothetical protein E7590_06765 [Ruminococcaceae bacterium]|nr:hypothetical protein [Oscillospiraceae bacterium]